MQATTAPGQVAASQVFTGVLVKGQAANYVVAFEGGRCYTILGVGGTGVRDLDLWLYDPTNRKVESDKRRNNTPSLRYCAEWPGNYRVQAEVRKGGGELAVQAYVVPLGAQVAPAPASARPMTAPPVAAAPQRFTPRAADPLSATVDEEAAQYAPGARRVGEFLRGVAERRHGFTDWIVNLEAGKCYSFVGVGGPGVEELSLFLWAPSSSRVSAVKPRNPVARMSYCALLGGPHRLEGKTGRGAGELRAAIYVR